MPRTSLVIEEDSVSITSVTDCCSTCSGWSLKPTHPLVNEVEQAVERTFTRNKMHFRRLIINQIWHQLDGIWRPKFRSILMSCFTSKYRVNHFSCKWFTHLVYFLKFVACLLFSPLKLVNWIPWRCAPGRTPTPPLICIFYYLRYKTDTRSRFWSVLVCGGAGPGQEADARRSNTG